MGNYQSGVQSWIWGGATSAAVKPRELGRRNVIVAVRASELTSEVKPPDPTEAELIQVSNVDLRISENVKAHHTNEFDITDSAVYDSREFLVVRRGQDFVARVNFNRPYDEKKDDLRIVFQFGKRPMPNRGTHVEFILSARDVANEWGGYIQSKDGNSINIVITTPANIPVGKWNLKIDVVKREDTSVKVFRYEHKEPIYMLFNPWCKNDLVYMPDQHLLGEYILNETGKIYVGSTKRISPRPWVFGQFTGDVLDCILYLLDKSTLSDTARGDPVLTSRVISKMINSPDDNGVLEGNWSGDYSGGTSPLEWTGSVAILEKFYQSKQPVCYGQCWVFSGVVTTACRALGIPARSVTNFSSAHDTDGSVTIDLHFDDKGESLDEYNNDSVWNFHVWNDVWMAREDLPKGYGGWQAIDATPQELSDGDYCMGPVSLTAIQRGEVNLPYDGKFAFAEVNADRLFWRIGEGGEMEKITVQKNSVGRFISTKKAFGRTPWWERTGNCYDPDREDLTLVYKYAEGSEEERSAVRRANLHSTRSDVYETKAEDVTFEIDEQPDTFMGSDISLTLTLTNTNRSETRTVNGSFSLASMYYTGVLFRNVTKTELKDVVLAPGTKTRIPLTVPVEEYIEKLTDHCICRISCVGMVKESRQAFAGLEELRLRKPHLTMKAPKNVKVGETFKVDVTFENPLADTLSRCELRVEGPGLQRPVIYKQPNVGGKQTYSGSFEMTAVKPGTKEIVVCFNCNKISSVNASQAIDVK